MKRFVLALLVTFLMPMYAGAATLVDGNFSDAMEISFQFFDSDGENSINAVLESISEGTLIPYSSPYGASAIVNPAGGFFDSTLYPHPDEIALGFVRLALNIQNFSPFPWSDFHFGFYSIGDTVDHLSLSILSAMNDDNGDEVNDEFDTFELTNYDGPGEYSFLDFGSITNMVMPGESVAFDLKIAVDESLQQGFVLRQIATTPVPLPSAMLLLGIGLTGFAGIRRKLNR